MRNILSLDSNDLKWLEDKFERYQQLDREIAIRKEELKIREDDQNIGGGKSNVVGNPIESQIIREQSDPFIVQREAWKRGIDKTIQKQNIDVKAMIEDKYWGENSYMDWVTIGEVHGFQQAKTYRIRYKFLEEFAKNIGYI
ncbi:hypothetical protein [Jeotgalibaca porci]|uniref:hypothetical protein n=1 Tax=Jeotgalibaca porci TaxID=1868793 RepID=UPI0035A19F9A